ncbi:MAG: LysM peptidoglycan-binding domain-containing protein [Spirochaetaceae bacterium]|nr:LysM peptidoglycan-binding domain-containing protein [Spirochaetaceae bacterium]
MSSVRRERPRRVRRAAAAVLAALAVAAFGTAAPAGAQTLRQAVPATLEIPDHPRVHYYARSFSSAASRQWLLGVVDRASFFAHHILGRLDEHGMPPELLFLPGIESGFFNTATSPAGAVGLWQLMGSTARHYGLITDELVDERRDFWKATDVALRVLKWNHAQLGNWELALAAYNAGLGRVSSSVRYGGTSNYWELQRRGLLPRETSEFVPRYFGLLLALRNLPADQWPRLDALHRWRRVPVPLGGIELRQLGQVAGVPRGVLERANAELRYGLTPVRIGANAHQIKVPAHFYERLTDVIASGADLIRFHRHTVRTGDTISELAEAYRVTQALIREYNQGVNPRRLQIGTSLHIPLIEGMDPADVALSTPRDLRTFTAQYQVVSGDSLWKIAQQHDTTVESLVWHNDLPAGSTLHPGQVLRVPYRWAPADDSGFV